MNPAINWRSEALMEDQLKTTRNIRFFISFLKKLHLAKLKAHYHPHRLTGRRVNTFAGIKRIIIIITEFVKGMCTCECVAHKRLQTNRQSNIHKHQCHKSHHMINVTQGTEVPGENHCNPGCHIWERGGGGVPGAEPTTLDSHGGGDKPLCPQPCPPFDHMTLFFFSSRRNRQMDSSPVSK